MTEQEKRKKVVKGLECCMLDKCTDCPYYGSCYVTQKFPFRVLFDDALALLKAQEPRVMTLEELKALPDYVFLEDRDTSYAHSIKIISRPALPQLVYINTNGEECVGFRGPDDDTNLMTSGYGKDWRCWTSRPTDAQRKATPWNG